MSTAVIDLGTNTFHLLIAELSPGGFKELFRQRRFVKLGEHSADFIGPEAFQRGLGAIIEFSSICKNYHVQNIFALGTAMLRNAINTASFIEAVFESTGISITVIDGLEEARLIFQGVKQSGALSGKQDLLMDIGGGSVEFIFSEFHSSKWTESLDIGVSLLKHRFPVNDQFGPRDIHQLEKYLDFKLREVTSRINGLTNLRLIGISGTFDVINDHFSNMEKNNSSKLLLQTDRVLTFCDQIIPMSLEQKLAHPSIPESRADLISYALIMVKKVLQNSKAHELKISHFSIKEGKIADLV